MDVGSIVAVIMAGGEGTRFWPRSRQALPKQFLSFDGNASLLRQTVERLKGFIRDEQILIITGAEHVGLAREHSGLPARSIVGEPCGRDTAACIGLGARLARSIRDDAVMVVLSADHMVRPVEAFREAITRAAELAAESDVLVAVGLRPDRPATGYGYIEVGAGVDAGKPAAWRALSFREKPDLETARRFLLAGNFLWNSGIFAFRPQAILDAMQRHLPDIHAGLAGIRDPWDPRDLEKTYPGLRKISIDYGIMEHAANKVVVEASFEWDDLGTFEAVARHATRVGGDNLAHGEAAFIGSRGSLVDNTAPGVVVVSGLDEILVVRTPDAVLVLPRSDAEKVKDVVKELKNRGLERYL